MHKKQLRPEIEVASAEYDRLSDLAVAGFGRSPGADCLSEELERATIVPELAPFTVGINDVVTFEYDGSHYYEFQLVYPTEADFKRRRLSVLTPVGAMLLGLSEGQSIHWYGVDGRSHRVSVDKVSNAINRRPAAAQEQASTSKSDAWPYAGLDLDA